MLSYVVCAILRSYENVNPYSVFSCEQGPNFKAFDLSFFSNTCFSGQMLFFLFSLFDRPGRERASGGPEQLLLACLTPSENVKKRKVKKITNTQPCIRKIIKYERHVATM